MESLVDNIGSGVQARNAIRFSEDMKSLPNVTVPGVYLSYTSRKVRASRIVYFFALSFCFSYVKLFSLCMLR